MWKHGSSNRAYRLIWNRVLGAFVVAPETAGRRGKVGGARVAVGVGTGVGAGARVGAAAAAKHASQSQPWRSSIWDKMSVCLALGAGLGGLPPGVLAAGPGALPSGGTVTAGAATLSTQGNTLTVDQGTNKAVINWQTFDIGSDAAVNFVQPSTSSVVLNRVVSGRASEIYGNLTANGQVYLVNSAGILFGSTAQVNVGALVASALKISDADFLAGNNKFTLTDSRGSVVNQGLITAKDGGRIVLLGATVSNTGTLVANGGDVALAAGRQITIAAGADGHLKLGVDAADVATLVHNGGLIQADGGQIVLTAQGTDALAAAVVSNTGTLQARTVAQKQGKILLLADLDDGGTTEVAGTLDASAPSTGNGGFIETSGATVNVAAGTRITTRANSGTTGTWLIDPTDFTISTGTGAQSSSGIGADTLAANLQSTSVTLATDNSAGSDSGDINVNAAVSWSANTTLTLNAYNNININAAITATGTNAGLVLNYGNYASTGSAGGGTDYNIHAPITLSGADATLGINGNAYTLIHSMAQLTSIDSTGLGGDYALAQDLDASGTTYTGPLIGDYSSGFSGTFAGLGHAIANVTIAAGSVMDAGLFGFTSSGSVIRDLGLPGGSIVGGVYVGSLVGVASGTITDVYATGSVSAGSTGVYVGGLVGGTGPGATITNAYATGSVTGGTAFGSATGGVVGLNEVEINNAYATGAVSGGGFVGGLVGLQEGPLIENVYATGAVSGRVAGGLIGEAAAVTLENAYSTGSVSGGTKGGVIGINGSPITLTNTYWDTTTSGMTQAVGSGSTAGMTGFTTSNAYTAATYSGFDFSSTGAWYLVEGATRPFLRSEWSTTITNAHQLQLMAMDLSANYTLGNDIDARETSSGTGMWSSAGFSPVGSSTSVFTGSLDGQGYTISGLTINRPSTDYVGLIGFATTGSMIRDLGLVGASVTGYDYVGSLAGVSAESVSNVYASGTVNGDDNVGGLVGVNEGGVSRSSTSNTVTGTGSSVGGLVGYNGYNNSVSQSYASGTVNGAVIAGGLVGTNYGEVNQSYASGAVNGSGYTGGLVGANAGDVTQSYATGAVSGGMYSGGLAGLNSGSVSQSFATGAASGGSDVGELVGYNLSGSLASSFWLLTNGSTAIGASGGSATVDNLTRGLSAQEARSLATYMGAGWDIDDAGGTGAVWRIYDGNSLPLLRTFLTPVTVTVADVADKTYDGTTQSVSASGYSVSDPSAALLGSASYSSVSTHNAGTYALGMGGLYSNQQGYDIRVVDGSYTITPATLTAGITASGKIYDGTTAASTSGTLNGVFGNDDVTLVTSGTFVDKNAGTGKTVNVTGSLSGTDAVNYTLTFNTTTFADIVAKAISATITASGKIYDGTTAATTSGTLGGGVVGNDDVTLATSGNFADKNVGTGKTVNVSGSLGGFDAGNYTLTFNTTALADILAKAISATITANGKIYDGTTTATTSGTLSGVLGNDDVILATSGAFIDKNAGTGKTVNVSGSLSGADANNYTLTFNTTTLADILAKAISATITASGKIYDGTTTATTSGTLSGVIGNDDVKLATSGVFTDKNAGAGKTVTVSGSLSGTDANNYTLTFNTTTLADILAKALTVTANDVRATASTPYSGGNDVTYAGFVNGEDAGVLGGSLVYGGSAQGATRPGTYTIAVSGLTSGNYAIQYQDGTLTMVPGGDIPSAGVIERSVAQTLSPPVDAGEAQATALDADAGLPLRVASDYIRLEP